MAKENDGPVAWQRNADCKIKMRGMAPWACDVVQDCCKLGQNGSICHLADAYTRGALRIVEELAPQCLECRRQLQSKSA